MAINPGINFFYTFVCNPIVHVSLNGQLIIPVFFRRRIVKFDDTLLLASPKFLSRYPKNVLVREISVNAVSK